MEFRLRPATPSDRHEIAELIYASTNAWYQSHGRAPIFTGGPGVTEVFYEVYDALAPGCTVVACNSATGRLAGSCFYHPRERHVSLGIMNVHPNYFGMGIARRLLDFIVDFTDGRGYRALRLHQSAFNLDSFSLYTRAGFVPRHAFQDMVVRVPETGMGRAVEGLERVRDARFEDAPAMAALELEVSGITREPDCRYTIENRLGFWRTSVFENARGGIDGWLISSGHPALNILGPCVARSESEAAALILSGLDHHRGRSPLVVVPMECASLVRLLYSWGARNAEIHLCQVRGDFQPFRGISMPSFLPETG